MTEEDTLEEFISAIIDQNIFQGIPGGLAPEAETLESGACERLQ